MKSRKTISKKTRFEVFKRDDFTCAYCGSHPPRVILEIDHITPVADGGGNDQGNLITSCFDCNRGKGARSIDDRAQPIRDRAAEIEEREEQIAGYRAIYDARIARINHDIDEILTFIEPHFGGYTLTEKGRRSIKLFLEKLDFWEVVDAVHKTVERFGKFEFRYFCGICWRKIKGEEVAK